MRRAGDDGRAALVVLGCRVMNTGAPSRALERRLHWARVSYDAGFAAFIVVSGGRRWGEHVEADRMAAWLEADGVPARAIRRERCSLTTAENALFTAAMMRRLGVPTVTVATCAWHMPRALLCFERAGLLARPLPAPAPPTRWAEGALRRFREAFSSRVDAWSLGRVAEHGLRGGRPADVAGVGRAV